MANAKANSRAVRSSIGTTRHEAAFLVVHRLAVLESLGLFPLFVLSQKLRKLIKCFVIAIFLARLANNYNITPTRGVLLHRAVSDVLFLLFTFVIPE